MGTLTITYPDAKAVEIYTALAKRYAIDVSGMTNAEAKIAVDQFIRDRLRDDYIAQKREDEIQDARDNFVPPDPEFT